MCGIFGYVGTERNVPGTVGVALKALEYRGYDSWGMVWREADRLATVKQIGKVPTSFTFDAVSRIAVGHTRWATHGGVTKANAHPHLDPSGRVAIVHNGIVENATELRMQLVDPAVFASETDSEIIAHLLAREVMQGATIVEALRAVFPSLQGQNAVIAIDQYDEVIAAAMNVSPLVIGYGGNGTFISSDPFALSGKATEMVIAPNDAVVCLGPNGITAFRYDGTALPLPDAHPVPEHSADELGAHQHFMTKEMSDQPGVLRAQIADDVMSHRLARLIAEADQVVLTGCGSAYYAARIGATWLNATGKRAVCVPASEFDEAAPFLTRSTLVIAVTQSGETADVLEAMRKVRQSAGHLVALVNVVHSSAARLADDVVPLLAGRERSVLATKSMTAMLARLLVASSASRTTDDLDRAAEAMECLALNGDFQGSVERASMAIAHAEHVFVIGKGIGAGVAQEAALKIKEASYVHAEAFAAGELKHGAIALVDVGTPCLVFDTDKQYGSDIGSSAHELRSRGGYTIGVGIHQLSGMSEHIALPDVGAANPLLHVLVAQYIAYRVARLRNLDPDYPRNLAKSVTVK